MRDSRDLFRYKGKNILKWLKRPVFYFLTGVIVTVILLFVIPLLLRSCSRGDTSIINSIVSPSGEHNAIFIRKMGGGAAGYSYENVAVTYKSGKDTSIVMTLKGANEVELIWIADDSLLIKYPEEARVDFWKNWFGIGPDGYIKLELVKPNN